MKVPVKIKIIFCLIYLGLGLIATAQPPATQRIQDGLNMCSFVAGGVSPCDSLGIQVSPMSGSGFVDYNVRDIITLGIDHSKLNYLPDSFKCKVIIKVVSWNQSDAYISTKYDTLWVIYQPFTYTNYLDKSSLVFKNAYKYNVTIDTVIISNNTYAFRVDTLPINVYLDMDIQLNRYYTLNYTAISPSTIKDTALDVDCDGRPDQVLVCWQTQTGAQTYDLEWTFVNDYANVDSINVPNPIKPYLDSNLLSYNFRFNSTRINTAYTNYKISLPYEHGFLAYRVRGVGVNINKPSLILYQSWSLPDSSLVSSAFPDCYHIIKPHQLDSINYQYNATFAEEGKKKEVVTYYDGSLRSRQAITQMNSDSNVLAGQTIYDFQGRPAVTVLPVPVQFPSCSGDHYPAIRFYPRFNLDDSTVGSSHFFIPYTRYKFDQDYLDSCTAHADSMSAVSGASNYYSPANPNKRGYQAFVPQAHGYPFSQVQYTPDNTGRIRSQGGVGPQFQLGSGHETKYVYGQPYQLELDRMFGEEAGDATHYKKNVVIDPNGQASVTYTDQEGRTIATCLAGNPGTDSTGHFTLNPLPSQNDSASLTVDLFAKNSIGHSNNNSIDVEGNRIVFNTQISVGYPSNYFIHYSLHDTDLPVLCSSMCLSCVYILQIELTNDCGQPVTILGGSGREKNPLIRKVGTQSLMACGTSVNDTDGFVVALTPGNYTLSKILTVDDTTMNYYLNLIDTASHSSCVKTLADFQSTYLSAAYADTCSCHITCATCMDSLGTRDFFVASGKGTAAQYDFLYQQCGAPCRTLTLCDAEYQQMLADVSPNGQYGQYMTAGGTVTPSVFAVSVFNTYNALPANVNYKKGYNGNWQHPKVLLNGNTYYQYVDQTGNRSTVPIDSTSHGFVPDVNDSSSAYVFFNASTSQYYTYPENLKNFSDFIGFWQPTWAQSLVMFHPEYNYYNVCLGFENVQTKDTISSETFDEQMMGAKTFQQAIAAGFITHALNDTVIVNLFKPTTGQMHDPFLTDSIFNAQYSGTSSKSALDTAFSRAYRTAIYIDGHYYNMMQEAAVSVRCGNTEPFSTTCTDFGGNMVPLSQALKDSEWNEFKNFYLSLKKQYQFATQNRYALTNGGYNVCIGDTNFSLAGMFPGAWTSYTQPCDAYNFQYYISKQRRFVSSADIPNASVNASNYQSYQQTGQCPWATELQGFLAAVAQSQKLDSVHVPLSEYVQWTPDLYTALIGTPMPAADSSYYWKCLNPLGYPTDSLLIIGLIDRAGHVLDTIFLNKADSGVSSWALVQSFQDLQYLDSTSGYDNFSIIASWANTNDTTGREPYFFRTIRGKCGLNIHRCSFQQQTHANAFAFAIRNLMSMLASFQQPSLPTLTGTNVNLENPATFQPVLAPAILNALGSPNKQLRWSYLSDSSKFEIFDHTKPNCKIELIITSMVPSGVNLTSVAEFDTITSNGSSSFTIKGQNSSDNTIVSITCAVKYFCLDSINESLSTGTSALPTPLACQGAPYSNLIQLDSLLKSVLIKNDSFPNIDLNLSPYYTMQLASFLPAYLASTSSREIVRTDPSSSSFCFDTLKFIFNTTPLPPSHPSVGLTANEINDQFPYVSVALPPPAHYSQGAVFPLQVPELLTSSSTELLGITPPVLFVSPATLLTVVSTPVAPLGPDQPLTFPPDSTSCPFYLTRRDSCTIHLSNLIAISGLTGYGPLEAGNYTDFYFIATYKNPITHVISHDTVFGHSCIPLQNCTACNPPCNVVVTDTFVSPPYTPRGGDPCVNQYIQNANANALNAYNNYIDSITTAASASYLQHCLGAVEGMTASFIDKQYHYTLYYYDQGGNLVRTVPPQGVQLLPITSSTDPLDVQINADKTAGIHNYFTNDVLSSTYVYNSLNQLTEQNVPDADNMNIWNFTLPNGLNSSLVVTGTQFTDAQNGYLSGYVPAGATYPGIYPKRGYLYKTHNAGNTWQQISGTAAANLTSVTMPQMGYPNFGYAVGDNGVAMMTIDGGISWDILPLYTYGVTQQLNAVTNKNGETPAAVVGNGVAFTLGGSSGTTYTKGTGISSTDNLMSVAWDFDNSCFYAVGDSSGYGVFYKSDVTGSTWTKVSSNTSSLPLYKVQFLGTKITGNNPAHGFATGLGGMLLHTTDKGNHWFAVPNYLHKTIRNIYFITDNIGIALVDSIANTHSSCQLYQTSNGGQTWTLLSTPGQYFYDMNFYYDNTTNNTGYKGVAVGNKGVVTRIVSQTNKAPYFALISLNSPNTSDNLTGAFAESYSIGSNGNLYITTGGSSGNLYYTTIPISNSYTSATWHKVSVGEPVGKTAFVLNSSNMLPVAVGATTGKIYLFSSSLANPPVFTEDTVSTFSARKPFYELYEHGTVNGSDTIYTYGNNSSDYGLFYLKANGSGNELAMTAFSGTNPSSTIISVGYSASGHIAGVDSASGNIFTGAISSGSVSWTNVSQNIHPLTLYSISANFNGNIIYETGLRGELLYSTTGTSSNFSELLPVTSKTLYAVIPGLVAGDSASMYSVAYSGGGFAPTYSQILPPVPNPKPLYSVVGPSAGSMGYYAAGASGTVYYIPDLKPGATAQLSINAGANDFIGITDNYNLGALAVGTNGSMWTYGSSSAMPTTSLYTPGFNAENFTDQNHGYVVGDSCTIRRTDDGGNTWQLVLPDLTGGIGSVKGENYNTVWTTGTGQAIVAGNGNFIGNANTGNLVHHLSGYGYTASGGSSAETWNKIKFNPNFPNAGYMVGNAGVSGSQVLTLGISADTLHTIGTISTSGYAIDGNPLYALHVFRDNSVFVAGANGLASYYNPTATPGYLWQAETPTIPGNSSFQWNDVWFRDDRTGWMVGDSISSGTHVHGEIIKTISPVNIQPPTAGSSLSASLSWNIEPVEDGFNIVSPVNINYNTIAFSGAYDGFVGGAYTNSTFSNSGYPYARKLSDRGGVFSTLLWYDRIGRQNVSQNTLQHNYLRQAYSYTLYDSLNRITEVGQKTENSSIRKFTSIFGDTIFGFNNPALISQSKFLAWINDNTGPRTEVTHNYYDKQFRLPPSYLVQNELRNRIACITYSDTSRADSSFKNASYYSYDVHGNVQTFIQDDSVYNVGTGQRYKRIDYQYDLVANKINEVDYQNDSLDQFHHRYIWDADNRISQVQTSKDSVNWDNDVNYFYYAHLPLARIEYGDQQVQGEDYAYTLQGWVKGVNSDALSANKDMGEDGLQASGNLNSGFARDAMGYTIKYFDKTPIPNQLIEYGDYDAIDTSRWNHITKRFEAYTYGSDLTNSRRDLFNGNVTAMNTNIQKPQEYSEIYTNQSASTHPQGTAYGYDQLNRMVEMKAFANLDTATNVWGTAGIYNGRFNNWLTYDANGNILTQKKADSLGNIFDSLTYHYNHENGITVQNRLYHVNNAISGTVDGIANNIRDEGIFDSIESTINQKNNYRYNAMGELAKDTSAGLDTLIWTVYGKIWKIKKYNGDSLIFTYDGKGDRILKEFKPASGSPVNTYYIRDAQGNILSIYTQQSVGMSMSYSQTEKDIYGSHRVGAEKTPVQLVGTLGQALKVDTFKRYLGNKEYELDNQLGNVLAVVSDRKIPRPNSAVDSVNHYEADVISSQDYYAFGWYEPGRNFNSSAYRYGFNNKLKDDETYGSGNEYDFGARLYDPRLGRWLAIDHLAKKFPELSPYTFVSNSPIRFTDPDGNTIIFSSTRDQANFKVAIGLMFNKCSDAVTFDKSGHLSIDEKKITGTLSSEQKFLLNKIQDIATDTKISVRVSGLGSGTNETENVQRNKDQKITSATVTINLKDKDLDKKLKDTANGKVKGNTDDNLSDDEKRAIVLAHELGHIAEDRAGNKLGTKENAQKTVGFENKARAALKDNVNERLGKTHGNNASEHGKQEPSN